MVAGVGAELLGQVAHLGTAQQYVERPVQRRARTGQDTVGKLFLLGRHGVVAERLEAASAQMQVARVGGGLGVHNAQDTENSGTYGWQAHEVFLSLKSIVCEGAILCIIPAGLCVSR